MSLPRVVSLRGRPIGRCAFLACLLASIPPVSAEVIVPPDHNIMPAPVELRRTDGRLAITAGLSVAARGHDDARLQAAITRALQRWEARTGFVFAKTPPAGGAATLVIECKGPGHALPAIDEDESYALDVSGSEATLRAPTVVGAMRGLETLLQLLNSDANGWFVPAVNVLSHAIGNRSRSSNAISTGWRS
jgi:hexosaminidase